MLLKLPLKILLKKLSLKNNIYGLIIYNSKSIQKLQFVQDNLVYILCVPVRLLCSWDSPSKNTGLGCHFLLQGIFLTQGPNPHLLHCRWILYQGSPYIPLTQSNSQQWCLYWKHPGLNRKLYGNSSKAKDHWEFRGFKFSVQTVPFLIQLGILS